MLGNRHHGITNISSRVCTLQKNVKDGSLPLAAFANPPFPFFPESSLEAGNTYLSSPNAHASKPTTHPPQGKRSVSFQEYASLVILSGKTRLLSFSILSEPSIHAFRGGPSTAHSMADLLPIPSSFCTI